MDNSKQITLMIFRFVFSFLKREVIKDKNPEIDIDTKKIKKVLKRFSSLKQAI